MKIAILAKNPYYFKGEKITPYLAGHSIGFVAPFIEYLIKRGHKVSIISPKEYKSEEEIESKFFNKPPKSKNFFNFFVEEAKFPKVPFNFGDLMFQNAIIKAKKTMGGLDIVLVVYIFPWIVAVNYLKKDIGFKTVAFLRGSDVFSGCFRDSDYKKLVSDKETWDEIVNVMVSSLNKSDLVYSVSNMLKRFAGRQGIKVDKICPTPPFPNSQGIKEVKRTKEQSKKAFLRNKFIRKQFGKINKDTKWIAYLGRLHSEKQVSLVVDAFNLSKNHKGISLIIAGTGLEKKNLQERKAKMGLKNMHIGFVPPKLVPLFCKSIDIMIHPATPQSFMDARPSSCMNAAFMGVPVIFPYKEGIEGTGLSESVSSANKKFLAVNPNLSSSKLSKEVAKKIDLLFSNKKLYNKISAANSRFAARFEAYKLFKNVEKELRKCLR